MSSSYQSGQSESSVAKNTAFFRDQLDAYKSQVDALDTYRNIRASINSELTGLDHPLDIGNGGTFDYDVSLVRELIAVDLFLEDLPPGSAPANVVLRNGSALNLPFAPASFDGVIMVMLIHHLIGNSVAECWDNAARAVAEAVRVLEPGGKLVIVESCVPPWFYRFERVVFPVATRLIGRFMQHPATLQFPPEMIESLLKKHTSQVEVARIPTGRWLLQYGIKYPAVLTPAMPYRFVARKS